MMRAEYEPNTIARRATEAPRDVRAPLLAPRGRPVPGRTHPSFNDGIPHPRVATAAGRAVVVVAA